MTKRLSVLTLLGAFALLALAATPAVQASDDEMARRVMVQLDPGMATLTGCLNPGKETGWFVLTTDDGDVAVKGGEAIAAHAHNHKVKLTGAWVEGEEGHKYFDASSVEHMGVCE